ncbi:MAG: BatA domain-containing protein [Myxococcota bacterium]|nr:BatA domain-containing protein [Myxococcota bacterium]
MQFLAPAFVAFTAVAVLPVLIHLVGRSRARIRPFPAMDFLLAGHRHVARRTRVRQLLLLLLRAAIMATVPLCLAKPFVEARSDLPPQVSGAQSAVLLLDDSLTMGYRLGGTTLLQRAKTRAARILSALGSHAEVALVLGSQGAAAPVPELTGDRSRLLRALSAVTPSYRPADLPGAMRRAAQILQGAQRRGRRIYLLSHLSARSLEPGLAPPPGVEVVPVDVAEGQPLPNRAVVDLHVEPAPSLGPAGVRIQAEVYNAADQPVRDLPVTLLVDGRPVARGLLDLPAQGRAVKRFYHVLSRPPAGGGDAARAPETGAGLHDVTVEIEGDGLPADDRRHLRVEVQRRLRVLLIDGDPRTLRRNDEVFYLEMALHPGEREDHALEVLTTTVDELPARPLSDFDAVFLCNVRAQEAQRGPLVRLLLDYVRGGGGLFITVGSNVEPEAYNTAFAELLPQPLAGTRTTGPVRGPDEDSEAAPGGPGERLERMDRHHPLLQPFLSGHAAESLLAARFFRYMLLRPTPRGAEAAASTVLGYESGAPALLERPLDKGRVLLLTSTIDRDWNDLPIQPAFLPLVQQAVRYLAGSPLREPEPPALVGQRQEIKLRPDDTRVEVTLPSGRKRLFERERLQGRKHLSFTETDEPGPFRVAVAGEDRVLRPRPTEFFVVNVDVSQSDLRRASAARIEQLAQSVSSPTGALAPRRRVELWHALGALLLALLVGEALLLREK